MTFAALSTAPLLVSMLSGCGGNEQYAQALYGPPNVPGSVTVNGMAFLDSQSNIINLSGNQTVPVHTSFIIEFNVPMNVAAVATAITFIDSNNSPVAFVISSDYVPYSINFTITPTADLEQNTNYTLSIGDTATDSYGNKLIVNANASAAFKTSA